MAKQVTDTMFGIGKFYVQSETVKVTTVCSKLNRKWNYECEEPYDDDGGEHLARRGARSEWKDDRSKPIDAKANQGDATTKSG